MGAQHLVRGGENRQAGQGEDAGAVPPSPGPFRSGSRGDSEGRPGRAACHGNRQGRNGTAFLRELSQKGSRRTSSIVMSSFCGATPAKRSTSWTIFSSSRVIGSCW